MFSILAHEQICYLIKIARCAICDRFPLGQRLTRVEEIANSVVFLASQKSGHTTGQIIYPDGGYVHLDRAYRNDKS